VRIYLRPYRAGLRRGTGRRRTGSGPLKQYRIWRRWVWAAPLKLAAGFISDSLDCVPSGTWGQSDGRCRGARTRRRGTGSWRLPVPWTGITFSRGVAVVPPECGAACGPLRGRRGFWATATPRHRHYRGVWRAKHIQDWFFPICSYYVGLTVCGRLRPRGKLWPANGLLELCRKDGSDFAHEMKSRSCDRTPLVGECHKSEVYPAPPTGPRFCQSSRLRRCSANWVAGTVVRTCMRWARFGDIFRCRF